jgi:hypothetical protein
MTAGSSAKARRCPGNENERQRIRTGCASAQHQQRLLYSSARRLPGDVLGARGCQHHRRAIRYWGFYAKAARGKRRKEFATARAIRRSLKLPTQEPEPLAHGPPHEFELLDQIA